MEESSHLNLMTMALLQTCGYVIDQMQSEVNIDINQFLQAFSIKANNGYIRPPSWTKNETGSVVITPSLASPLPSQNEALSTFNMDDYRQCRQAEALRWINLQEKRASIIARLQPVSADEYQERRKTVLLKLGPLVRKKKKTGLKYMTGINSLN